MRTMIISVIVQEDKLGSLQADLIEKGYSQFEVHIGGKLPFNKNKPREKEVVEKSNVPKAQVKRKEFRTNKTSQVLILKTLGIGNTQYSQIAKVFLVNNYSRRAASFALNRLMILGIIRRVKAGQYEITDNAAASALIDKYDQKHSPS